MANLSGLRIHIYVHASSAWACMGEVDVVAVWLSAWVISVSCQVDLQAGSVFSVG